MRMLHWTLTCRAGACGKRISTRRQMSESLTAAALCLSQRQRLAQLEAFERDWRPVIEYNAEHTPSLSWDGEGLLVGSRGSAPQYYYKRPHADVDYTVELRGDNAARGPARVELIRRSNAAIHVSFTTYFDNGQSAPTRLCLYRLKPGVWHFEALLFSACVSELVARPNAAALHAAAAAWFPETTDAVNSP